MLGPQEFDGRHEREYFDRAWADADTRVTIQGGLHIPGLSNLEGKRVLICSCGSGRGPVEAWNDGAREIHAVDISPQAVRNAVAIAGHNRTTISASVQDIHMLSFHDGFFDVVYGSAVLHHLIVERALREVRRVLAPDGVGYFRKEPTFINPLLKIAYRARVGRKLRTRNEKPLDRDEFRTIRRIFPHAAFSPSPFMFLQKASHALWGFGERATTAADRALARRLSWIQRWGYEYDVLLRV